MCLYCLFLLSQGGGWGLSFEGLSEGTADFEPRADRSSDASSKKSHSRNRPFKLTQLREKKTPPTSPFLRFASDLSTHRYQRRVFNPHC